MSASHISRLREIYVPERMITYEGKNRFKIYLPSNMRKLWRNLKGKKVDVIIIVEENDEGL